MSARRPGPYMLANTKHGLDAIRNPMPANGETPATPDENPITAGVVVTIHICFRD